MNSAAKPSCHDPEKVGAGWASMQVVVVRKCLAHGWQTVGRVGTHPRQGPMHYMLAVACGCRSLSARRPVENRGRTPFPTPTFSCLPDLVMMVSVRSIDCL